MIQESLYRNVESSGRGRGREEGGRGKVYDVLWMEHQLVPFCALGEANSGCGAKARFFFRFRDMVPNAPFHLVLHSILEIRYIFDLKRVAVTLSL